MKNIRRISTFRGLSSGVISGITIVRGVAWGGGGGGGVTPPQF